MRAEEAGAAGDEDAFADKRAWHGGDGPFWRKVGTVGGSGGALYTKSTPPPLRRVAQAYREKSGRQAVISKGDLVGFLNRRLRRFDIALIRHSELWRMTGHLGRQPAPTAPPAPARPPLLRQFGPEPGQATFDFAVVIPSLLRPTLARALRSVFAQDFPGTVQTLIGIDVPAGSLAVVEEACRDRPANHSVLLLDPGYSTSVRHGGLHPAWDGGVLRTVLSYLAASRCLAYLDDDNWWAPAHLSSLAAALQGHDWAWSLRWHVAPGADGEVRADRWESVGPGRGVFAGGWVDPNCLALDKLACEAVLRWWGLPKPDSPTAIDGDRNVFRTLSTAFRGRGTGLATTYYTVKDRIPVYDTPPIDG
jgi:hypothetical protein